MSDPFVNLSNPRRKRRLLMQMLLGVTLALLPFLVAADDAEVKKREANQARLNEMTVEERRHFEENARTFQRLPKDQQDRLRELQKAIGNDPELKVAFADYQSWVSHLSPWQRTELRRAADTHARLRFVENLPRSFGPSLVDDLEPVGPPAQMQVVRKILGNMRLFEKAPGTARDAAALVAVLEKDLPADRRQELDQVDAFTRKVRVVRDTLQRNKDMGPMMRLTGRSDQVFRALLDALDDGSPSQQFVTRRPFPEQRMTLLGLLLRGLVNDLMLTVVDRFPNEESLKQFEQRLSRSDRDFIASLPANEGRVQLQKQYLETQVPGLREFREMGLELQGIQADFLKSRPGQMPFEKGRPGFEDNNRRPPDRPDGDRRNEDRFKDRRPD